MHKFAFIGALSLFLSSCAQERTADQVTAEPIEVADSAFTQAVAARDLERIAGFYAEDAVLMPTAEPIVSGKAAIREEWQHILSIPDFQNKAVLTRSAVSKGGDMAYTMGTYVATLRGENDQLVEEPGKWLTVWARQGNGSWLIVADMYNTDIPPPDHK